MQVLRQAERSECGLVSIAMLASAHGYKIDLVQLRSKYSTSNRGTTLEHLVKIADDFGLNTRAVSCEIDELNTIKLPVMLHWNMDHFVVLAKRKGKKFIIHDPASGKRTISAKELDRSFTGVLLEAWPGPNFEKRNDTSSLKLSDVIPTLNGFWSAIVILFVLTLGIEFVFIIIPIIQQFIIDEAIVTADLEFLQILVIVLGIFLVGRSLTEAARGLLKRNLSAFLSLAVSSHGLGKLFSLPVSWFERRSRADIINRFESGGILHYTLTSVIILALIDGLVVLVAVLIMFLYSPLLAIIVLVSSMIYLLVRVIWYDIYRKQHHGLLVEQAKRNEILWETLSGIATIKSFNGESLRHSKYIDQQSNVIRRENEIALSDTGFLFSHNLIISIEQICVFYIGATDILSGNFTIGMFIAFLGFRDNFVNKSQRLTDTYFDFRNLEIHLDRLSEIHLSNSEYVPEIPFLGDSTTLGSIEAKGIYFRYGDNEDDVLTNVNFKIEAGEAVALTGTSGSGKSSLLKIISGEYEARQGDILIDNVSIRVMGLERLRNIVTIIRQDDQLFAGSIAENIAFLDPNPDIEKVMDAARAAQIFDEIQKMPMGFNSLVGTSGTGFSGGQLQRIMIARALYRKTSILILDEATSSLDLENEAKISDLLKELKITQILVAHRPSTIASADRIIDIEEING